MTSAIDHVRLGWAALAASGRVGDAEFAITRLPVTARGEPILLALDAASGQHLLVPTEHGPEDASAVAVQLRNRTLVLEGTTQAFADIVCPDPALRDAYDHLLAAMLEAVARKPDDPRGACLDTLGKWRHLLRSAADSGASTTKLAGLVGELLVVKEIVAADPGRRIDVWAGPTGGRHDLRRGTTALEVKTTLSHTERRTTVHGIDQLEPPAGNLSLVLTRLEPVADGPLNVVDLAEDIIGLGAPARDVYERMTRSGSPAGSAEHHRAVTFALREQLWYAVDNGFPRLTKASLIDGTLPDGVKDVTYDIDLDGVPGLSPSQTTAIVDALAKGAEGQ